MFGSGCSLSELRVEMFDHYPSFDDIAKSGTLLTKRLYSDLMLAYVVLVDLWFWKRSLDVSL